MATHDEQQQARRFLDRAEKVHSQAWTALIVAVSLVIGGLYQSIIGVAGLCVLAGAIVTWAVGERYVRAANRILNRPYRQ